MRFKSLDVFRGLTIFLMILVNSPGNNTAYAWLTHSPWNGCTLADLVFPFFLVIVGASSVLALSQLKLKGLSNNQLIKKILRRSFYLFLLGVLLNVFPIHFDISSLRVLGVLQRIAICYCITSVFCLINNIRLDYAAITLLLIVYGLLIAFDEKLGATIDLWVFSSKHLYNQTFDPEGLLSTLPAIASTLLGNLLGYCLVSSRSKNQQYHWIITVGLLLSILGWLLSFYCPFNKSLWTSSYVLWTAGLAYLVFALCFVLIEIKQWKIWSKPFYLFGRNALLIYILHVAFLKIQATIKITTRSGDLINLKQYITQTLFGALSLKNASLAYALTYALLWLAFLHYKNLPIYKKIGYSPPF